ncbi:MAG TPA: TetR/AcrR family transcriptional regulator [Candidatus Baltobacteraceae bacterium]|jgi:AcrR family transcriptional regulator|nr:TetR/AcrR family transcriptional regulator [Candidatus Baltobacteraceae bacterium]
MGAVERRARERTEFRELVLTAARKIVLRQGFEALSMRKIADEIEYAPGTIYLYFKSRDEIAQELCRRGFEDLLASLAPAAAIRDPAKRLTDIGERYVRFGLEHPETYRMIFMEDPKFADSVFGEKEPESPGARALQFLVEAFDELRAQKRLRVRTASPKLADALWVAVHGIVSLKLTCPGYPATPADELTAIVRSALFDGLLKPG